ncbi:MAG: bifunctional diguanylate cyclase/phosphodiesterase [Arcobacteraceae bacterium]
MNYKILLIDDKSNFSNQEHDTLALLEDTKYYFELDFTVIENLLQNEDINMLIINPSCINLDLVDRLLTAISINEFELPIIILSNEEKYIRYFSKFIVFDFIDMEKNRLLFFNKIKFFNSLYKKDLQHKIDMQKLLYVDSLTQLPNRTKLISDIRNKSIGITALAIIDINSFKEINDFFGYKIGDSILQDVVQVIETFTNRVKNHVILYKFAADVYCLANVSLSESEFENVVVYILGAIESKIFVIGEHEIDIRATAGVTFSIKNNKLITANIALQVAKKNNKDYIVFYEELDNFTEYQNNMLWTKKLKYALEKDNIIVYFQPLVNNETMNVDKYECLVRMIDNDKVIAPFFFLDVSKKANQYRNITKIVIEKSFKEFENLPFEFSINVSYEDIEDKNFLNFIKYKLQKYNVASRVVWEILEDVGVQSYDVLFEFIKEVKALGCKVAIDDFGSGYSNFEHLLKMDVDYLKIDASLIKHVATDENSYKVVKTIIDFAKSLHLKTIAEYVENEEIFNITKDLGADFSQGYHFCAPIAKPSIEKF